jgi:hypothetical protein
MTNAVELQASVERLNGALRNLNKFTGPDPKALVDAARDDISGALVVLAALRSGQGDEPLWFEKDYASSVAPLQIDGEGGAELARDRWPDLAVAEVEAMRRDANRANIDWCDSCAGYSSAFFEIKEMLGLPAMPISPREAWLTYIRPMLRERLLASPTPRADGLSDKGSSPCGDTHRAPDGPADPVPAEQRGFATLWFDRAPFSRSLVDDLNGYITGGSTRCLDALEAHGAQVFVRTGDLPASKVGTARSDVNPDNSDGLSDGEGSK